MKPFMLAALTALCASAPMLAQTKQEAAGPGERALDEFIKEKAAEISKSSLASYESRESWEKARPELHRQLLDMMGLWPLPAKSDLKPVITGKLDRDAFSVEKIHFQSIPGVFVTGNLYIPKKTAFPAPTILYLCGHARVEIDGIPQGNKVAYQHHGHWFASNGYVCFVIDTLQLGEVPGLHHGTNHLNQWWWHTVGYTPAGIELWNGMRAVDYLLTRPEVDGSKLGVTGRSGGGATSWWVGAADERVKAIVPVAGIADLESHVVAGVAPRFRRGVIEGHCDCMYFHNTYQWDFSTVAALCAPRPVLLGNSDADDIFPVPGYRRLGNQAARIYDLYGAADRFALLETKGPHKDTLELRLGAYGWMNRWLKGITETPQEEQAALFKPGELKVLAKPPGDAINATLHETFIKPGRPALPESAEVVRSWWPEQRKQWLRFLESQVFRPWLGKPAPKLAFSTKGSRGSGRVLLAEQRHGGLPLSQVWIVEGKKPASGVKLRVMDEAAWQAEKGEWRDGLPPVGAEAETYAIAIPGGVGPLSWAEEKSVRQIHNRRRLVLLGMTEDAVRIFDVRTAIANVKEETKSDIHLHARGSAAGWALYAAIGRDDVKAITVFGPPSTHTLGPTLLNVRRVLDMPQAVALLLPTSVTIHCVGNQQPRDWDWPLALQRHLGLDSLKIAPAGS